MFMGPLSSAAQTTIGCAAQTTFGNWLKRAELKAGPYFPITSIGTVIVFGGRHWVWSQAW